MVAPRALAKFNRRVTNRVLGRIAPGLAMVKHVGRKSGKPYRTPVKIIPTNDGSYLIALAYGTDADWVRNVIAAGGCEVTVRGRDLRLTDPEIVHDPKRSAMPAMSRPILGFVGVNDFLRLRAAD